MRKSTKILLIIYIAVFIASLVMGKFIINGIKATDNGFEFNFDIRGIIALVLTGISIILGFILYFRFLASLTVDKMLFFSSVPLVVFYGLSIFLLVEISILDNTTANSVRSLLNLSPDNLYNTILWAVLLTIVFIMIMFFNYMIACKPINKMERIVLRLGDGKVKENKLNIGGGKQFQNIEHGLNKINNNYKEKDRTAKQVDLEAKKFIPKQFFRFLGKNNIAELELGNQVKKRAITMSIKLEGIEEKNMLSLEENFQMINSYLNIIAPLVRKFGGFVDKYLGDGIIAVFGRSENAINSAQVIIRAIDVKNRQNKTLPNVQIRVSIISGEVIFGIVGEEDRKIPTIVSDVIKDLNNIDEICKYMGIKFLFTKNIIDDLPLNFKINYRYVGSINAGDNKEIFLYECIDIYSKDYQLGLKRNKKIFERAVIAYNNSNYYESYDLFSKIMRDLPDDKASYVYLNKAKEKIDSQK